MGINLYNLNRFCTNVYTKPCSAGQYFDGTTCKSCSKGKYCPAGSLKELDCPPGHYSEGNAAYFYKRYNF